MALLLLPLLRAFLGLLLLLLLDLVLLLRLR